MKLLLDQQLSRGLLPRLQEAYPGSSHTSLAGLSTSSDVTIWEHARVNGFAIVTKDEDFQLLAFARGHPPKVIWLRSGNAPTSIVLETLLRARSIIKAFAADDERSLLVLP